MQIRTRTVGSADALPDMPQPDREARTPEALQRVLRRERARADREGRGFVVVVFGFEAADQRQADEGKAQVRELLRLRLRATDVHGHLDDGRLVAVLSETRLADAQKLLEALQAQLDALPVPPVCTVFRYPPLQRPLRARSDERAQTGAGRPVLSADPRPGAELAERTVYGCPEDFDAMFLRPIPRWKRALDVLVAAALLPLLAPLLLLAALAIKLDSPGPVFFKQKRAGRGGRPFDFYKLRTMVRDAESRKEALQDRNEVKDGPAFKITGDPRITRVGSFLRKTSLDELPQLWNVLKGDMSLVGTRPPTMDELPRYDAWQRRRLEAPVGITGIWQVSGRSLIGFQDWVKMDLRYLDRCSLSTDLSLLARTLPAVVSGRGAK